MRHLRRQPAAGVSNFGGVCSAFFRRRLADMEEIFGICQIRQPGSAKLRAPVSVPMLLVRGPRNFGRPVLQQHTRLFVPLSSNCTLSVMLGGQDATNNGSRQHHMTLL